MRHLTRWLTTPFVLLSLTLLTPPLVAASDPEGHQHAAESLGRVHFEVSCGADHQAAFDRAIALLHSFGYEQAAAAFNEIAAARPDCGMAYWGAAMSDFHQVWGPPSEAEWVRGRAAAEKAKQVGAPSERERDWIAALDAYYLESAPRSHPQRVLAYSQAMDGLAAKYPQDHEAQIFHALAILAVAYNSPPDKTYARQKQAAAILSRELKAQPEHPGIAHYMIHSFDYPDLAPLALDAARAYAKIAPAAPHALHMPSHIFTRLGLWQDSIASNLASAETARAIAAKTHPGATSFDGLHAMDYLEYAYLQTARDQEARGVRDGVAQARSFDVPNFAAGYALAAVPSRYALERRAWADAAGLAPAPASFPWEKFPYAEAIVHFARAVGAARSGDLGTARSALARLSAIESGLEGQKGFDWATQVKIQRLAAAGWIAHAERQDDAALQSLRAAADLEDTTDKHPVTPG
ncbi:MAG: hypothetical protein ACM3OB_01190, partial [Acidobacteriota bacterium]